MRAFAVLLLMSLLWLPVHAEEATFDSDGDGLSDAIESNVYYTDSLSADTDGDGYPDGLEIEAGYHPNGFGRLYEADTDGDGLNDADELLFGSSLALADSDGDGYPDGAEVEAGYDPTNPEPVKLRKWIEVVIPEQRLTYHVGPKPIGEFTVSTGRPGAPTPVGTFRINDKIDRAWSVSARLWMPYWMPFIGTKYGLHELPEWPGGIKEGEDHLGQPVSGGCIRLGVGAAETLYEWVDVGTEITITDQET